MKTIANGESLSTGQVAEALRIGKSTVARMIDEGALPGHRIPGSRFRRTWRKDLLKWVEARPEFGHALEALGEGATR